ncbi:MAG: hypothetical protein HN348_19915 [Proteobacteria bacterium]|jgi:hypothetical protein|nr:hypothetical protein [Pseudomonadota bacterium]
MLTMLLAATIASANPMNNQEWTHFLENYPNMHPDQIYMSMTRLSREQALELDIYSAVAFDVHLFACQGNYAPYITYGGGCQAIFFQYQQTVQLLQGMGQYGSLSNPRAEAEIQRGNMVVSARCASGAIDAASCSAYLGHQGSINQMQQQTSDTILEGFNSTPCTEYYNGQNVYLGCW